VSEDERRAGVGQAADDGGRVSLLEQFMPRFDTRCQHAIEVHAPAQAVFTAVEAVTVKEVRFLRELEFIRALPRLATTGRLDVPTVDAPLVLSFTRGAVLLGARPPEEVLAGAIKCFSPSRRQRACRLRLARGVPDLHRAGIRQGRCRVPPRSERCEILLTTETRFVATDEATHRLMSRYCRIIRPGSNRIRRSGCERSERARFAARKRPRSPHNTSGLTRTVRTSTSRRYVS
jgi:hypothetical protein